jgi:host factor-I protein
VTNVTLVALNVRCQSQETCATVSQSSRRRKSRVASLRADLACTSSASLHAVSPDHLASETVSALPYGDWQIIMKNGNDSTAVGRALDPEAFANRKLIRPSLTRGDRSDSMERRERPERTGTSSNGKKVAPPEQTHAENFYYQKQMQTKTQMVVVLNDGEEVHGMIEWYDKCCIKLTRSGGQSNLLIYKPSIKYMYKESESTTRK